MTKWEYMTFQWSYTLDKEKDEWNPPQFSVVTPDGQKTELEIVSEPDHSITIQWLNKLGADGWEVFATDSQKMAHSIQAKGGLAQSTGEVSRTFWLKRQRP